MPSQASKPFPKDAHATDEEIERLRGLARVEFVQWAVAKLGGVWLAGWERSRGFQGQIIPSSAARQPGGNIWYPVLAKQKDKVGRPDIDGFEAVMMREERELGYFVAFDFTRDARFEIDRFQRKHGISIKALTVREILEERLAPKPH